MIDTYALAGIFPDVHNQDLVDVLPAKLQGFAAQGERGSTSESFEPLGGETFRMEAIWRAAPDSRRGPRLG